MKTIFLEEWRYIPLSELRYQISNYWNVKCLFDNHKKSVDRFLKHQINKNWYHVVSIKIEWKKKTFRIHRLVAENFIFNKLNKETVNHISWDKSDNSVNNLEWMTAFENLSHAHKTWLIKIPKWKDHWNHWKHWEWKKWKDSILSKKVAQCDLEWNLIKLWNSLGEIWRETNFSKWTISAVCIGSKYRNTAYWFKWNYILNII